PDRDPRSAEGRHNLGGGTCPVAEGLRDHPPVRVPDHRLAAPPTPGGSFFAARLISRSFSPSWPSTSSLCDDGRRDPSHALTTLPQHRPEAAPADQRHVFMLRAVTRRECSVWRRSR